MRDDDFLAHDPGPGHPESPARLAAVHADLDRRPLPGLRTIGAPPVDRALLARVHSPAHIARIEATADKPSVALDPDTRTSPGSARAAMKAAGAVVEATRAVVADEAAGAFALVRPPGHHAERDAAMGFCLFNNVAVAAEFATTQLGLERVLVLDPDVHHGNGTQSIFWRRRDVLFVSTHQWPLYPGTGAADEVGAGEGSGYTVNVPLPPGRTDADYLFVYRELVEPIVAWYEPQLVLVSAGFDTWHRDPLGGMQLTGAGYLALFALFRTWADAYAGGRLVYTLEGGYDPEGVVTGVRAALESLSGIPPPEVEGEADAATRAAVERVRSFHREPPPAPRR